MAYEGLTIDPRSLAAMKHAIDKLAPEFRKSAEKAVLRAGARPILKDVKKNLSGSPVKTRTGLLKKSMGVSIHTGQGGFVSARIGSRNGVKYRYKNGNKTGRRSKYKKGKAIATEEVAWYLEMGTPKMQAKPFIRPALETAKSEVINNMEAGLDKHLTKVVARLAKK